MIVSSTIQIRYRIRPWSSQGESHPSQALNQNTVLCRQIKHMSDIQTCVRPQSKEVKMRIKLAQQVAACVWRSIHALFEYHLRSLFRLRTLVVSLGTFQSKETVAAGGLFEHFPGGPPHLESIRLCSFVVPWGFPLNPHTAGEKQRPQENRGVVPVGFSHSC